MENIIVDIKDWIIENDGYYYYETQLSNCFKYGFETEIIDNVAFVYRRNYQILAMVIEDRSVFLIPELKVSKKNAIQKKLFHEYCEAFELYGAKTIQKYRLTQYNFFWLYRYLEKECNKIDYGFDKYTKLLSEQELSEDNTGFIKIHVHNSFSIAELNNLLSSYNKLYSLLSKVLEVGIEETERLDVNEVETSKSMVLESISLASEGFFIAVLSQVVAAAIIALGKALLDGDKEAYEAQKNNVINKANNEGPDVGARATELLIRMDNLLRLKESGRVPTSMVEYEINRIIEEIKPLQGLTTIDYLI